MPVLGVLTALKGSHRTGTALWRRKGEAVLRLIIEPLGHYISVLSTCWSSKQLLASAQVHQRSRLWRGRERGCRPALRITLSPLASEPEDSDLDVLELVRLSYMSSDPWSPGGESRGRRCGGS